MTLRFSAIIAIFCGSMMGGCPEFTSVDEPTFTAPAAEADGDEHAAAPGAVAAPVRAVPAAAVQGLPTPPPNVRIAPAHAPTGAP
ncbi:MAG: hypothetical protein IPK60_02410 [Sandaracinaceae bacterium]|nr:hypothetical protein [Sandaracinaceae bacterium]